jgi:hypothetical protein
MASYVAGNFQSFGHCAALRYQTRQLLGSCQVHAFGQPLYMNLNSDFHGLNRSRAYLSELFVPHLPHPLVDALLASRKRPQRAGVFLKVTFPRVQRLAPFAQSHYAQQEKYEV